MADSGWQSRCAPGAAALLFPPPADFTAFLDADIESSIGELFERQAARFATSIAIRSPTKGCSYEELNRRANRIGRWIMSNSANPLEPVALLMDKDVDHFAAVLGVVKAGRC